MIHLAAADIIVILGYFAAVVYVGFRAAGKTRGSEEDFLLAGRSLTLPVFVMTLVSTWYGGILGVGEFSYRYGIANWFTQGLPYYIFALVFALTLAKKIRETNLVSVPDKLQQAYGTRTALFGSGLTFILMTPAPYILMLSVFLQMLFGWDLAVCLIVTSVVAASYLYWGGFRSDVQTDVLEFFLMFAGFAVILPFACMKFGGAEFLRTHLPPLHLTWHGGNSIQYILVWFFIALWTLVDPAFHQRCYAAKSGAVARNGILWSIGFWLLFDFMTATAGLYARAALPGLQQPMDAYPALAEAVLPPIAKGMFYVGMLATIMSTLNTLVLVSAQTLGRDIILRATYAEKLSTGDQGALPGELSTGYTKIGFIASFVVSIGLAVAIPSVVNLWYTIGTVIIPGLLVPLMASYFGTLSIPKSYAFAAMVLGFGISSGWLIAGYTGGGGTYPLGIEPMYPGLGASLIVWIAGIFRRRTIIAPSGTAV